MTAYSGFVTSNRDARRHASAELDWLSDGVIIAQRLGTPETTGIVHPRKFTSAMMRAARGHGTELRRGRIRVADLEALLAYEGATKSRAPFQTLLANRITRATAK